MRTAVARSTKSAIRPPGAVAGGRRCGRDVDGSRVARSGVRICSRAFIVFFSSRRRHTRFDCDWSSDVCSSDLELHIVPAEADLTIRTDRFLDAIDETTAIVAFSHVLFRTSYIMDAAAVAARAHARSEERRVGKEGRSRWAPDH